MSGFVRGVVGLTLMAAVALAACSSGGGDGADSTERSETVVTELVLRPGQTQVTGVVTGLTATGAVTAPLPAPFTVNVPARGAGGATISNARVAGRSATITWDGGRPLPVTGTGALDLGPARVEVAPQTVRWLLDGIPRVFTTGNYRLGATVAVGGRGLAAPRDGVTFDSDGKVAMVTKGGARIEHPPRELQLEGPGTVQLKGRLQVRASRESAAATSVSFGEGAFLVRLTPTSGGYQIDGLFQGARGG
ncbi:MAG TPA: hypothetical protein VHE80_01315 [Acidimicrobiales bacterium]|nr:hypothetical protein [Acidimicrobiales bacterium]